jgi:redox-sensitive bicupin YhaK (pirin superfamily)
VIRIVAPDERHFTDFGWLQTYWLFSFSNYYDPENLRHGALRVFNDDVVQSGKGFPTHPHEEMEITTIVLAGEVTHEDSMGNKSVIKAGDVQRMSAGTGLTHSEYNLAGEPALFYQIWIEPRIRGVEPSYDQRSFEPSAWNNALFPVASGQSDSGAVTMNADATIYRGALEQGKSMQFDTAEDRKILLYVTAGELDLNGTRLVKKAQARIAGETSLALKASEDAEMVLVDAPEK